MLRLDQFLNELKNKEKIDEFEGKIVNMELEIDKIESRRLIIKKCLEEMENKLEKLQRKAIKYPENEEIEDEVEDTENKVKEGTKLNKNINDQLSRKEIALVRLKQERKEEIRKGLIEYLDKLKLKHEKLQNECIKHDESVNSECNELKEMEEKIEHINQLIKMEFGSECSI